MERREGVNMAKEVIKSKIAEDIMFDNSPIESDDYETEAQILDTQIRKEGVKNIGVVASYGAGKSSAITTYLKRYRRKSSRLPKFVQISLANFNSDEKSKDDSKAYSENAIERSILQQLLYSQKKNSLPKSSINRTNKSNNFITFGYMFLALAFIFSVIVLAFEISGNSIFERVNNYNSSIIKVAFSCVIAVSLILMIFGLGRLGVLRKVKYKDFEINVDAKGEVPKDYSLFNNFINEVLYFFECVNVDLVIFEDLDRLENLKIFVKLRELNTIINNSPKRAGKVTFLYAVKDSMFKDEIQRAKFFEFILPIVPVINPITTYDNILQMHDKVIKVDATLKLFDQFMKDISFFVSDMRVLKNTFNDYVFMSKKLADVREGKLLIKRENLFALALYKNLYPYDYSRLQQNEGLIPICINKDKLVEIFKKVEEEKIEQLEAEKERIEKEWLKDFNDLKLMFKGQHFGCPLVSKYGVQSVDQIESFQGFSYLQHPYPSYSGYAVQVRNLPTGETYLERENNIKSKITDGIEKIGEEIRSCKNKIEKIESQKFNSLITEYGVDQYFSESFLLELKNEFKEDQINFVRMLINKNYLDEDYLDYISDNKSKISAHDREFIRNVKQGYIKSYNYKLDSPIDVLRNLNEEDFLQSAILIGDVCASLKLIQDIDNENVVKTNKFKNIMYLLSDGSENVLNAVIEFLAVKDTDDIVVFADYLAQNSSMLIEELLKRDIGNANKDIFVKALIKLKKYEALQLPFTKSYIESHTHYLILFEDLKYEDKCQLISKLGFLFSKLDVKNGKDDLYQFIVKDNYYAITVDNLKIVLDIDETRKNDFEFSNYTFIQQNGDKDLKNYIGNNLKHYINNVYAQLPDNSESENTILEFLNSSALNDETKYKIINHTKIILNHLKDIDVKYYELLLYSNKVIANWDNIFAAYSAIKFGEPIIQFISQNKGRIQGSFATQDGNLQVSLFKHLLDSEFEDDVQKSIAKSVDQVFYLDSNYAKNENARYYILEGCFDYNVQAMSLLLNTPGMMPYLICYQDKILKEMKTFYRGSTFESSYGKRILEEEELSNEFKNEFWFICGAAFVNFNGIENQLAEFLVQNECKLTEGLLYKFTNLHIDSTLKMSLLSLAVKQKIIINLQAFKSYVQSINCEFAKLWTTPQKITVDDDTETRTVIDYMRKSNLVSFTARKGKLHLISAS